MQRRRLLLKQRTHGTKNISTGKEPPWIAYWQQNPINAWTGGNRDESVQSYFKVAGDQFIPGFSVAEKNYPAFESMAQELLDYRLTAYESRRVSNEATNNVIPFPSPKQARIEVPYFPNLKIARWLLQDGSCRR